jgi:hypothetical protein
MDTFTIKQIADCLMVPERTARKLLNEANGTDPKLDELHNNPGELVTREHVVNLIVMRTCDRVGRRLAELLKKH